MAGVLIGLQSVAGILLALPLDDLVEGVAILRTVLGDRPAAVRLLSLARAVRLPGLLTLLTALLTGALLIALATLVLLALLALPLLALLACPC